MSIIIGQNDSSISLELVGTLEIGGGSHIAPVLGSGPHPGCLSGAVALRCCGVAPFIPLLGRGWEASRRWIADCSVAGIPARRLEGGAVPDREGGAVPDREGGPELCEGAGDPTRREMGSWLGLYELEPLELE